MSSTTPGGNGTPGTTSAAALVRLNITQHLPSAQPGGQRRPVSARHAPPGHNRAPLPQCSGGENDGESSIEAMLSGLKRPRRPHAVKIVVLVTDEPALISWSALPGMVAAELLRRRRIGLESHDRAIPGGTRAPGSAVSRSGNELSKGPALSLDRPGGRRGRGGVVEGDHGARREQAADPRGRPRSSWG